MKIGLLIILSLLIVSTMSTADSIATLRKDIPLNEQAIPEKIYRVQNEDVRKKRSYPMQPPLIPHEIRGYQIDLYANKCLYCHSRSRTEESRAPMVSVTHFMDRDGNFLAQVSPRRYFCLQCHVPQTTIQPLVKNEFKDLDEIVKPAE